MTDPRSLPESSRDALAAALRYAAGRTQAGAARDDATRKAAALPICQDCGRPHWTVARGGEQRVCSSCRYFASVRNDRRTLSGAIEFLRSRSLCAYCGEAATDVEHVVPRSSKLPTYTVPACKECNGIAGAIVFPSFLAKLNFIQKRIRVRYAKVLKVPEWTDDEIEEMGYAMQQQIIGFQRVRNWVLRRIDWDIASVVVAAEMESLSPTNREGRRPL